MHILGGACIAYGGEERCIEGFGGETLRKETTWKTPGVDGRIILRWIFRKWAVVNAVMNFRVS